MKNLEQIQEENRKAIILANNPEPNLTEREKLIKELKKISKPQLIDND